MALQLTSVTSPSPFKHDSMGCLPLDLKSVTQEDGKRHYQTPEGKWYPSITTVLSGGTDTTFLDEWRARVGEEEARRISGQATRRGTVIHKVYEDYLNNVPINLYKLMPNIREIVRGTLPVLNRINTVVMQESALYSNALQIAGRTDLIGVWDGTLSVVDFKGSNKEKKREWILSYFAQCAGYAIMFRECYGIEINQCVVIVSVEGGKPQVFQEPIAPHIPYLLNAIEQYKKNNNDAANGPTVGEQAS